MKYFLILIAMTLLVTPALADHHKGGDAPAMPPMGKPAEMSKLDFFHGEWNVTMEFKATPDAAEWTKAGGHAVVEPILDGVANRMTYTGEIMGMPFNGYDTTTYNREYQRYESVWLDSMGAKFSVFRGDFEDGKLVMKGTDKQMGVEYHAKMTTEVRSEDEIYWVMYMSTDEGATWEEGMRMTYTRAE